MRTAQLVRKDPRAICVRCVFCHRGVDYEEMLRRVCSLAATRQTFFAPPVFPVLQRVENFFCWHPANIPIDPVTGEMGSKLECSKLNLDGKCEFFTARRGG
jgi:hypothetical protein